ncbi:MAG TPA: hypothetical protein VF989_07720 [Polyangiaceae bacterium]
MLEVEVSEGQAERLGHAATLARQETPEHAEPERHVVARHERRFLRRVQVRKRWRLARLGHEPLGERAPFDVAARVHGEGEHAIDKLRVVTARARPLRSGRQVAHGGFRVVEPELIQRHRAEGRSANVDCAQRLEP